MTLPVGEVIIAIPDVAGDAARARTLASLARHTSEPHTVVLMQANPAQTGTLSEYEAGYQTFGVPAPFGAPAALNRLLRLTTSPYLLLLESGAVVTAGWLSRLLAPLADPAVGLSGPSTNTAWNEQQVEPRATGLDWPVAQIEAYATQVAARFGNQQQSLDTLHSLADFCYLFKRSAAEEVGGFDEAYGAGPCWEIDFNTRAARAGFKGVWVAGAYVHRGRTPSAHVQTMRRLFEPNKRLYQDRFCGLRLRGEKHDYRSHCRGEACEHFAPVDLIQITLPQKPKKNSLQSPKTERPPPASLAESRPAPRSVDDAPLVSCIMPTRNRRLFITQAIHYFTRQDYPNKELIIIDDGDDAMSDLVPPDPHLRYVALPKQTSIGEKRNLACRLARGQIIAHWDDDDWYRPHRLRYQIEPLLAKTADVTGLETACFFDLSQWQAWTVTPELHRRLFVGDVHGGTLVYWRWVWEKLAQYPSRSLAEDALFLRQACRRGARLQKLVHDRAFVYLRHESNAWRFPLGTYLDPNGWRLADPDQFIPADDRPFYRALSPVKSAPKVSPIGEARGAARTPAHQPRPHPIKQKLPALIANRGDEPLVSCIMPTYNRRAFVAQAIHYFLCQDYPNRELLILDDGDDRVEDLTPDDPRIRYIGLERRLILGEKRNLACQLAQGPIIVHWDDDDWMAPHRLRYQVEQLLIKGADLCGAGRQFYFDPVHNQAYLYAYPPAIRPWLAGNTLCYRRSLWEQNPFPEVNVGEDARFVWSAKARNALVLPDHRFYVGLIHATNTSRKLVTGAYWRPHPVEEIYRLLGSDLEFYQSARLWPETKKTQSNRTPILSS